MIIYKADELTDEQVDNALHQCEELRAIIPENHDFYDHLDSMTGALWDELRVRERRQLQQKRLNWLWKRAKQAKDAYLHHSGIDMDLMRERDRTLKAYHYAASRYGMSADRLN